MKPVAVIIENERSVHLPGVSSDYYTACGIDGDDPQLKMRVDEVSASDVIDCDTCYETWAMAHRFRRSDFKRAQK